MHRARAFSISTLFLAVMGLTSAARGDEGMWLINQLPVEHLKQTYGWTPDADWIKRVQASCIRFGDGGSASFVSPNGLVMTNHHVGSEAIAKLGTADHDYMREGFYAPDREQELECPDAELYVLMQIEDVTDRVNAAVKPDTTPAQAFEARKAAIAAIEQEAHQRTGWRPETVKLYGGAKHHLYLYKVYDDVRLVMAPEHGIAFFGGDPENFEYPRYNLDVCFFRIYENNAPIQTQNYFRWNSDGAKENELVIMAGHPYRTQRLYTADHLRFLRDMDIPLILETYNQREVMLMQFVSENSEHRRMAGEFLYGYQNGRKAWNGILDGLLSADLMAVKTKRDQALKDFVMADPRRQEAYGSAWDDLREALAQVRPYYPLYLMLEHRRMTLSTYHRMARGLVRLAAERAKSDAERLPEYRETEIPSLRLELLSPAPIHDELEQALLEDGLTRMARVLGGDHPVVQIALDGQTPKNRAAALVAGMRLRDLEFRTKLFEGGQQAIRESDDPMIRFAISLDQPARRVRRAYEDQWESVQTDAYSRIAKAVFEKEGGGVYPDATGTLRLSFGTVKGYEQSGKNVPAMTLIGGTYALAAEHGNTAPYDLPQRWVERKDRLDPQTPFNFVSTNDIIGGNSGSPVFNKKGEIVGLVFDGNIQGLIWDIQFDEKQARAVSVHSKAIIEALRKVYDADSLADELIGKTAERGHPAAKPQ